MLRTSAIILGLTLLILGSGTYAIFHDTETSQGNYIEAGTLDLVLTDGPTNPNGQWVKINAYPGSIPISGDIKLHNLGSIDADHVEIGFSACYIDSPDVESDTNESGIGDWTKEIIIQSMSYITLESGQINQNIPLVWMNDGQNWNTTYISDYDGDNIITLYDLLNQIIDDLPPPKALDSNAPNYSDYAQFDMTMAVTETGQPQNDWQGDTLYITVHVALAQDSSQDVLQPSPTVEQCFLAVR